MKAKETRFEKYMKFWYGISGPLDEQKRQVMNQIGNRAFFIFFFAHGWLEKAWAFFIFFFCSRLVRKSLSIFLFHFLILSSLTFSSIIFPEYV